MDPIFQWDDTRGAAPNALIRPEAWFQEGVFAHPDIIRMTISI